MAQGRSKISIPDFHPKQQLFFDSPATKILLGGDTRAGKTAGTKLALIRWCTMIPGLQCDIFRLYEDDVIAQYMEGTFSFPILLNQWVKDKLVTINKTEVKFLFNGSYISLEHCSTDAAMDKHQGIPKHVRLFEEAGQIPERRMKWLLGWMTMTEEDKRNIPIQWRDNFPKILYNSNPIGPSKPYLRKVFVKARPKFAIEQVGAFKVQYIPFRLEDNPSEDAEATRMRIREATDEVTAEALLNENWDLQTGNYFTQWDEDIHVITPFVIPEYWTRFRTFDYGSYEPWGCLWWAYVGTDGYVMEDETYLPPGSLICYREWYGCRAEHPKTEADKQNTSKAPLDWSNADMARGIKDRTATAFHSQPTFTDSFPFVKLGGKAIADDFKDEGVPLTRGDTDRKNGWAQMANRLTGVRLNASTDVHYPMIYFFDTCKYCRDYIPMIERNPDEKKNWDAQETGECTHICDCVRLATMTHKIVKDAPVLSEERIAKDIRHTIRKPSTVDLLKSRGDFFLGQYGN